MTTPASPSRFPQASRAHRRSGKRWLWGIGASLAVLGLGWLAFQGLSSPTSGPARGAGSGLTMGMAAPALALPSTTAGNLSLTQYHGSKVVLYFYEGAG